MQNVIGMIGLSVIMLFALAGIHDGCGFTIFSYERVRRPSALPAPDLPTYCADPVAQAMEALAELESAGRYDAVGPPTKDGSRALGKYQVMDKYVGAWSKEIIGVEATPEQFLASSAVQDAVVYGRIKTAWTRHGNIRDVASVWFTGKPYSAATAGKSDVNMSNAKYVSIVEQNFLLLQGSCSADGSDWACPADQTYVTSMFGPRWGKVHEGVDIEGNKGNRNYAVADGVVEAAGWLGDSCGLGVQIKHAGNLKTLHCHNAKLLVEEGDAVSKGQIVGMTGTTGHSTGIHTHFEVMVNGKEIDPQAMLPARCVSGPKARRTLLARN